MHACSVCIHTYIIVYASTARLKLLLTACSKSWTHWTLRAVWIHLDTECSTHTQRAASHHTHANIIINIIIMLWWHTMHRSRELMHKQIRGSLRWNSNKVGLLSIDRNKINWQVGWLLWRWLSVETDRTVGSDKRSVNSWLRRQRQWYNALFDCTQLPGPLWNAFWFKHIMHNMKAAIAPASWSSMLVVP